MIDRFFIEGKKEGLVINQRKTVIMKIQSDDQINCIIDGEILPSLDSFMYSGTIVKDYGSLYKEF